MLKSTYHDALRTVDIHLFTAYGKVWTFFFYLKGDGGGQVSSFLDVNRPVHALRGIVGNQGKIAKKQSSKIYVYLHISILRFIFERKLIL